MRQGLVMLCVFFVSVVFSQSKGTISGVVSDGEMQNEPLPFANVFIKGTTIGTTTEFEGDYSIKVDPGTYILVFSFVGYETIEVPNVVVEAGKVTKVNRVMKAAKGMELEEIEITATTKKESEKALLAEQKKAVVIEQKIGAQELSRKGVSDAQAAVTKISGVSKQEGVKNVFVRGLGDRYNSTSLNGFPIPSEDPEYKNISLDFFGTDVIENIGVSKVFSSNIFGDVGGANINITSKGLSGGSELQVDFSAGVNTQALKSDFNEQDGVNYFGFSNSQESGEDLKKFNFQNSLNPATQKSLVNHSFGISGGKRFDFENGNSLSFLAIASHSTDFSYTDQVIRNTTTTGTVFADYKGKKSSKNISQIGLLNALYRLDEHKIKYNFMVVHNNNQYVGDYKGIDSEKYQDAYDDETGFTRRQQNNDNTLLVNQLITNWKLSELLELDAGVSYNNVIGLEPDRRVNTFSKKTADGEYILTGSTGNQVRYFLTLEKKDLNPKLSFSYKLNESDEDDNVSKIALGYNGRFVSDDFEAIEYDFTAAPQRVKLSSLDMDKLYNQTNLTKNDFEIDRNFDKYNVNKNIHSGYLDFIYKLTDDFIANIGARADNVGLTVDYNVNRGGTKGSSNIKRTFILPSLNLKYNVSEKSSFRLGGSKTYTLPQSKEISPYIYIDISFKSQGNQDLKPSDNYNLDLKWDYFMSSSEILSLTGFYKYIQNPIARVEEGGSGGYLTYKNISKNAKILGVELELRKNIIDSEADEDYEGDNSYKLTAGLNASYIYSQLEVDVLNTPVRKSELEGSAPILVNTDIAYSFTKNERNYTNSLVLNYFSDRIYTIGTLSYQDIIEKGVIGLDFVSSSQLTENLSLKLRAKNLLNPTYELSRKSESGNIILNSYKKGMSISAGLSYKF